MRWLVPFLLVAGVAYAGPEVEIRARTQLGLVHVKKVDEHTVEVVGYLRDKLTGQGIPYQNIKVDIGTTSALVTTGADGGFTEVFSKLPATDGPVHVAMQYKGDERLDQADPLAVTTDPARTQITMKIEASPDPSGVRLLVEVSNEDGNAFSPPVEISVTPVGGDTWKKLRTVDSNRELVLTRKDAGGAGLYRARAQYAGDATHQGALALANIELPSGSTTTMHLSRTELAFEDGLVVTGKVTDDDGKPLPRAAVSLMSGDRRLAQGTTDDRGLYRFEIEGEVIAKTDKPDRQDKQGKQDASKQTNPTKGQYGLQVQTDPGVSYIKGSHSEPQIVSISPPQPVPVSYTIVAFLATVIAAGGFFIARKKPWEKWRRPQKPAEIPSEEGPIEPLLGGLVVAKPGVVATLRRPSDDGFSGVVRDTVRGRPLEGALVVLTLGDKERSASAAADGSFTIEKLDLGEWRARVHAPGHIGERFTVTIPHRGELRGVRVDLVPVRERVFQLYRRAAEPVLPEGRLWGIWSPRQIVDHVRTKRPSPALAELTDFVEEIYFSARLADETVLPAAEGRVKEAVNERAGPRG